MTADKELSAILKKMKAGTADFEDMQRYSLRTAEIRAEVLKENLSPAGTGQNEEACIQLLKDQHEDVFQKESAVQKVLDEKQNIHIAAKKPKFHAERVRKAAHSLEDKTVPFETIQRRAENAVANIANSFHDDYIKENAKFRQNAGLKCHVTRIGAFECCTWCAEVAGSYEVGKEPADFWRRHDHCSCRMDYENQKVHQRLRGVRRINEKGEEVTTRAWKVDSEVQRRQAQRIEYKPTRLNQEQAKALENEKLSRIKGLTIAGKTDIMKESTFNPLPASNVVPILRQESESWISSLTSEEVRAIQKYTKNDGDSRNDKFYARLNAMLRGERSEDKTLRYYSEQISNALQKNQTKHDILCYRTLSFDAYKNYQVGDFFIDKQFTSTSVVASHALKNPFKIVIRAPIGSHGAYIEKVSGYPNQREFLIDKGTIYKVISKSENEIELEVVVSE